MSKINDLIKKLCPNGVVFKKIGEIANYRRGSFPQPYTNESYYGGEDAMPFVQVADVKDNFRLVDSTKNTISKLAQPLSVFVPKGTVIVTLQGTIGRVAITQYDAYVDRTLAIFEGLSSELNTKYFVYQLKSKFDYEKQFARGSTIKTITKEEMTEFKIPIPPIEVQEEIVKILDKFGELEAELEARKNQYEFWRGTIISNSNGKDGKLIELLSGPITDGPHTTPKFVSEGIPFISASAVHEGKIHLKDAQGFITKEFDNECSRKYKPRKWDVYMVKSGSTTGKVAIVDIDADFNIWSPLAAMRTDNEITSRYLYHLLQTKDVQEQVRNRMSHGSQPNLSMRVLEQFDIKIPTLEEQHCIVNILDKFDKLINDISEGLPAEIELRRKQYEYYRNNLLSFEVYNDE